MGDELEKIRHQLVVLCQRKKARTSEWSVNCPTEWQPTTVIDPQSSLPFTDAGAWEFVADQLENGAEIESLQLEKPPGSTGYVLKIPLGNKQLYVKLQLGAGKVIGRSFHYSTETNRSPKEVDNE
jgi:hypothetical protein